MKLKIILIKLKLKYRIFLILLIIEIACMALFIQFFMKTKTQIIEQSAMNQRQTLSTFDMSVSNDFHSIDQCIYKMDYDAWEESANQLLKISEMVTMVMFMEQEGQQAESFFSQEKSSDWDYQNKLSEKISDVIQQKDSDIGWFIVYQENDNKNLMVRMSVIDSVKCAVVVDLQNITDISQTKYSMMTPVVFYKNGENLTTSSWVRRFNQSVSSIDIQDKYIYMPTEIGDYLVVWENFLNTKMVYAIPFLFDYSELKYMGVLLAGFICISFLFAWVQLKQNILIPLKNLLGVMKKIQTGNTDIRADIHEGPEFSEINMVFNDMLDKINELKIQSYEHQLATRDARLNALRLQIRRHFFLNCLKSIYSMTLTGEIKAVQTMILLLSDYLRYTLDVSNNQVALKKELEMCSNYIEIQGIGQLNKPCLHISAEDTITENVMIPPISLLTLLENSCKYGRNLKGRLELYITIQEKTLDENKYIVCKICDNGPGFPENILSALNNDISSSILDGHVGINNVIERLKMLYENQCSCWFGNSNGACIILTLPWRSNE